MPKITALKPQRRNPELIDLHIDGELRASIAWVIINAERLCAGDDIMQDQLERVLAANECWKAKQAALSLLAVRARAQGELADRLRRKGFEEESVAFALAEAERLGFIDDDAFAEAWVKDRLRLRPRGERALVHELGRKRVNADVARAAVARVMQRENVSDDDLCRAAAERWAAARAGAARAEDLPHLERRLAAFLGRRGYNPGAIRTAIAAALRADAARNGDGDEP